MNNPTALILRAKKLGVLIKDARQARYKTVEHCAIALEVPVETFEAFEAGEQSPSLPELELLAYYLDVPIEHFWGNEILERDGKFPGKVDPQVLMRLRQRIIGVMLRKGRQEAGLTLEALADKVGLEPSRLEAYELGEGSIPLPELDMLVSQIGLDIKTFHDQHGPLGKYFAVQRSIRDFKEMPLELQAFVAKPVNRPYLELAQRLSEMSVDKLRTVAEGLLEITL